MLLLFYDHAAKHGRIAELGLDSFGAGDVAESLLQVRPEMPAVRHCPTVCRWPSRMVQSIRSRGSGWCSCSARWSARA
jgi:hypothetical protein